MIPKKINLEKVNFQVNWASGITIITLLISTISFFIMNQNLKSTIVDLSTDVKELKTTVLILKGSQDITNKAIDQFMQFPPSELKYRIEKLEKENESVHGYNPNIIPDKPFSNINPK